MPIRVVIRDDDISALTRPQMLKCLYQRVWRANRPVCFSVIPSHDCSVQLAYKTDRIEGDLNTPPQFRGQARLMDLASNPALVEFLQRSVARGHVEIALHGLTHCLKEFGELTELEALDRIRCGLNWLGKVLGAVPVSTFVPPYDSISPAAVGAVFRCGLNLSTSRSAARRSGLCETKQDALGDFDIFQAGARMIFTANTYLFDPLLSPERCLARALKALELAKESAADSLVLCVNHYWGFFDDWKEVLPGHLNAWNGFLDRIIDNPDVAIVSFAQLAAG